MCNHPALVTEIAGNDLVHDEMGNCIVCNSRERPCFDKTIWNTQQKITNPRKLQEKLIAFPVAAYYGLTRWRFPIVNPIKIRTRMAAT